MGGAGHPRGPPRVDDVEHPQPVERCRTLSVLGVVVRRHATRSTTNSWSPTSARRRARPTASGKTSKRRRRGRRGGRSDLAHIEPLLVSVSSTPPVVRRTQLALRANCHSTRAITDRTPAASTTGARVPRSRPVHRAVLPDGSGLGDFADVVGDPGGGRRRRPARQRSARLASSIRDTASAPVSWSWMYCSRALVVADVDASGAVTGAVAEHGTTGDDVADRFERGRAAPAARSARHRTR